MSYNTSVASSIFENWTTSEASNRETNDASRANNSIHEQRLVFVPAILCLKHICGIGMSRQRKSCIECWQTLRESVCPDVAHIDIQKALNVYFLRRLFLHKFKLFKQGRLVSRIIK